MNFNDFKDLVLKTRCTRRFKQNVSIEKSELIEVIDLARCVSSGKNMQPLKYIAITDEDVKSEIYKPLVWAAHLTQWNQLHSQKPTAYILVLNDTSIEGFAAIDSGIAMQTIMLGLSIKGYAGCMMASIDKDAYSKLFNLPKYIEPLFIIAVGVKDEEIKLVPVDNNDTNYYREDETHCVPKRDLDEVLINEKG